MPSYEPLINLEKRFDDKKGVYVLTLTGDSPFKIGATNDYIGTRIGRYVNCPSSHEGPYIHMLLVWDKDSSLDALKVEKYIFKELKDYRLSSNTRRYARTEHFDTSITIIKNAFKKAQNEFSQETSGMTVEVLKSKDARTVNRVGKRNFSKGGGLNIYGDKLSTHGQTIVFLR